MSNSEFGDFANLPIYLHNLELANPGSVTKISTDENHCFTNCFVAIGSVLCTFWSCLLPVIYLRSVPLRGDVVRTMFIAVAVDGNRQPVPLAYGFGTYDCVPSWTWFLRRLHHSLRNHREVAFLSNVSSSCDRAVGRVFPTSYRGYCCLDVLNKLMSRCRVRDVVKTLFWRACKCYTLQKFQGNLSRLLEKVPDQREWVESLGTEKWARPFFPTIGFNIVAFNNSDVLDLVQVESINLSIYNMVEYMRAKTEILWTARREFAGAMEDGLTPTTNFVFSRRMGKSFYWDAVSKGNLVFDVSGFLERYTVDIGGRTCTCGRWGSGILCRHAIATVDSGDVNDYHRLVNSYLTSMCYRTAYLSDIVRPLLPFGSWEMQNVPVLVFAPIRGV